MHVLLVDDNEVSLTLLEATLTRAGYTVRCARDGAEALDIITRDTIRLVVSDWEMPRMSGVDLCRALRARSDAGYVYFILITARGSREALAEGFAAGVDDFITKPCDPTELIARVRAGQRILSLETRDMAIFAMAKLAESRDPETGAHLERVRSYCRILARELANDPRYAAEADDEFVRLMYLTSPLHDIGKVGIPDSVLLKAGRLSDREFDIMKQHAAIGAETLDAALRMYPGVKFLEMARDIAATHHERWDGTGYPRGLRAEQIPLCGRIMALADVYDALTSKRVYKVAFTHDVTRAMIEQESATHFDPGVVDAFLRAEQQFIAVRDRAADSLPAAA